MSVAGRAGITYITLMRPSFPIRWYAALVGLLWLLALPAQAGQPADAIDEIDVACFGSPSSVEAWLKNIDRARGFEDLDEDAKKKLGPDGNGNVLAACIGTTSARACLESGRWHATDIYYPKEDPGVESWAQSAAQAVADTLERKFWA